MHCSLAGSETGRHTRPEMRLKQRSSAPPAAISSTNDRQNQTDPAGLPPPTAKA